MSAIATYDRNGHQRINSLAMLPLADVVLPQAKESEPAVVACILFDPKQYDAVATDLRPQDFLSHPDRMVFEACGRVRATGALPDIGLVVDELMDSGDLARIGDYTEAGDGKAYLAGLISNPPTTGNAQYYARNVRHAADKRRALEALDLARQSVLDPRGRQTAEVLGEVASQLHAATEQSVNAAPDPQGKPAHLVISQHPRLHEPIIEGVLRREETLNIIAAPKMGKSWLGYGLGLSVVRGRHWLGQFQCRPGRVLLIDNELHESTLANRLRTVAEAMGIAPEDFGDELDILSLRGRLMDIHGIARLLWKIEPKTYDLVILDALYRALPIGVSENDNAAIAMVFNTIDSIAKRLQCAWVNVHHSSKGNQAEKSVTDVGSGAGAQSRAADAHLVLRPHEEDQCVVLDAVVRSFAPIEPVPLRWIFPQWVRDDGIDPNLLRGRLTKGEERQLDRDTEGRDKILSFLSEGVKTVRAIRGELGAGRERCNRLLDGLEADGLVAWDEVTDRGGRMRRYSLKKQQVPDF